MNSHEPTPTNQILNDRRLMWLIGFALLTWVLAISSANTVIDLDLFHEMSLFREMLAIGQMPTTDSYAYTPTIDQVVHHEWGTGALLYIATVGSSLGAGGLMMLKYLVTFLLCIGCYIFAKKNGATFAIIAGLAPIALNLGGWIAFSTVRATLLTLLCLLIEFFLIKAAQNKGRWWSVGWLALVVVWGNLHGGVVAGIGIFGLFSAVHLLTSLIELRSIKACIRENVQLIATAVATPLMLFVNPYGWTYVPYLIRAVRMERPLIGEWRPIWECQSIVTPSLFVLSLLIALASLVLTVQRRVQTSNDDKSPQQAFVAKWKDLFFPTFALMLTAYLAAKHVRHVSIYAVTWICFVPALVEISAIGDSIKDLYQKYSRPLYVAATAFAAIAMYFSIEAKFWQLQVPTVDAPRLRGAPVYPVAAVDFLANNDFRGNLMVPFATGAYVSWKMYPNVKVSIDSRYEVAYPHGAVEENVAFYYAGDSWKQTLEKYPTDAVLIRLPSPIESALAEAVEQSETDGKTFGWKEVYRDESYCLYSRDSADGKLSRSQNSNVRSISFSKTK
jgi:hypothetical protein